MPSRFQHAPGGIPQAAGEVYCYLAGEILRTRAKWIYYRQLFMESERRVALLNKAAGNFFAEVQSILAFDLIISLTRLTDPARSRHQENLTVALLIERLHAAGAPELVDRLHSKHRALQQQLLPLRTRRSKEVAHYDVAAILTPTASPLPGLTLGEIRQGIEGVESILGDVHEHYTGGSFLWDALQTERDAESLLVQLCKAAVYDRLVTEGVVARGEWRSEWE